MSAGQRVAVIAGAGPAGLTAAWELLARTDVHPVVIEPTAAIGGIAQTYVYHGNRIDIGGHRFFSKSERVMNWWLGILPRQGAPAADDVRFGHDVELATEVVLRTLVPEVVEGTGRVRETRRPAPDPGCEDGVMLQRPRLSRIYFTRHFFPYPIGITLTVAWRLGLLNTFLITLSFLWAKAFPRRDETYLDAFFINRFGRRLYETFFHGYTEKVWGVPCREIRAEWGAQRVKGLSLKRAVAHAVHDLLSSDFRKEQQRRETSLITRFWYPKFGPGQMWETVAAQVRGAGGEIPAGRPRRGGCHGRGTRDERARARRGERPVRGAALRLLLLEHAGARACGHGRARAAAGGARSGRGATLPRLSHRRTAAAIVCTCSKRGRSPPDLGARQLDLRAGRRRAHGSHPDLQQLEPLPGGRPRAHGLDRPRVLLQRGRRPVEQDRCGADRAWQARGGAHRLRPGRPTCATPACCACPRPIPAYFGSYERFDEIRRWASAVPNLFCIGRNGMHRYNNQDHSMLTAMMAVDAIASGSDDDAALWQVNLEAVYGEAAS